MGCIWRVHKAASSWPLSALCERCDIRLEQGDQQKIDTVSSLAAAKSGDLILLTKAYIEGCGDFGFGLPYLCRAGSYR